MAKMNPARLVEYLGGRDKRAGFDGRTYRFVKNDQFKDRRVLEIDDDRAFNFLTTGSNAKQFSIAKDLERQREVDQVVGVIQDNAAEVRKALGITVGSTKKPAKKAEKK